MRGAWVSLAAGLASCAAPFARLDGVLVETRPAAPTEYDRVRIIREGSARDGEPGMSVEKGDAIVTAQDGVALLTLGDGYRVIFEPGTEATIENPSIFIRVGKIIVTALEKVKEKLTVNSEFASAGVEGTIFVYEVSRNRTAHVAVLEGRVTVNTRDYPPVTYGAGETGTFRPGAPPSRMVPLDPATERAIRQRIQVVEGTSRPVVPSLLGQPEAAARPALESRGLVLGRVTRVLTREVPAGTIARTSPPAGSTARAGDRVSIEVADSGLVVPDVLGLSLSSAARELSRRGLSRPDTVSQYQANARAGSVIGMSPSPGALVSATTRVTLTIARAAPDPPPPDTTRPPPETVCTVPRLNGLTESGATSVLRRANLRVGKISHRESGETVTEQNPPAGRRVKCGASVSFTIGTIGE